MSINVGRNLFQTVLFAALICASLTTHAEWGKGTVQDPVTLEYTDSVYKDWQEEVVLHPETSNYLVIYKDTYGFFNQVVFEPATKIDPVLKSKFKRIGNTNAFRYEYKLKNGSKAKRPIAQFITYVSNVNSGSPIDPKDWYGTAVPDGKRPRLRLSWAYVGRDLLDDKISGLFPGQSLHGLALESNDLPGIAIVEIQGDRPTTAWLGNTPEINTLVGQRVAELEANDFVPHPAAVPLIPVANPFDAAAVLTSMQMHVNQDLVGMKLIDPAFAAQLDRLFQTTIAAAKGGNIVALKSNLKDLRYMLKSEHADVDKDNEDRDKDNDNVKEKNKSRLIDKLAAKVLDFDLKYIEKQLRGDDRSDDKPQS